MKKTFIVFGIFFAFAFAVVSPAVTNAQMMGYTGSNSSTSAQTAQDEAAGKAILEKIQSKQVSCTNLSNDDFDKLGDYYMGQMMGSSHDAMDTLMIQRIGENNEQLMHIAMGKRLSGCDTSAQFPAQGAGFLPMMGMMGGWSSPDNYYQPNSFNSMMGNYYGGYPMMGYGSFGWLPMILWWALIIIGIVFLVRWAVGQSRSNSRGQEKSALDVLRDRYAKGEIDKREFEEKKKDLIN